MDHRRKRCLNLPQGGRDHARHARRPERIQEWTLWSMGNSGITTQAHPGLQHRIRFCGYSLWWPFSAKKAKCLYPTEPSKAHHNLISAIHNLKSKPSSQVNLQTCKRRTPRSGHPNGTFAASVVKYTDGYTGKIKTSSNNTKGSGLLHSLCRIDMLNWRTECSQKHHRQSMQSFKW